MPGVMLAKLTTKGQMTIPQDLRSSLNLAPGDYVVLRPVLGGIFLSKASVEPEVSPDAALKTLASALLDTRRAKEPEGSTGGGPATSGSTRPDGTNEELPESAGRRIAELTLAYLGREPEELEDADQIEIDSDRIAQAIAEKYGTDDIVEIIDRVRGRGGT